MPEMIINALSWTCLLLGGGVAIIGGVGLLRFPDFYSRLHAAGVTDTLVALLIVGGLVLQSGFTLLTFKLLLILLFLLFTAPTATHALARAALADNVKPPLDKNDEGTPPSNT